MEAWYVYIVECVDNTLYTGISNNVSKRVSKHNSGKGAKYTRSRLPVSLKWFKSYINKSEAAKEEYRIKKLSKNKKLKIMNKKENENMNKKENEIMNKKENMLSTNPVNSYEIDMDKIKGIEDVKLLLKYIDIRFTPINEEKFKTIEHLLIKV